MPSLWYCVLVFLLSDLTLNLTFAQNQSSGKPIFSCVDNQGKRHTSDRPIPDCLDKEQRVLKGDGSTRSVVPPAKTPAEVAAEEALQHELALERAKKMDSARRERSLLLRYPDQEAHNKARYYAISQIQDLIANAERRLFTLAQERLLISQELAVLGNHQPTPPELQQRINANEAITVAQNYLIKSQTQEIDRINKIFDTELELLFRLWGNGESIPSTP